MTDNTKELLFGGFLATVIAVSFFYAGMQWQELKTINAQLNQYDLTTLQTSDESIPLEYINEKLRSGALGG